MGKRLVCVAALVASLFPLAACGGRSTINSCLLNDANVGGDAGKSIKSIKGVLVWPLENIAAGGKSKGIETPMTGMLIDTLILRSGFDQVVILEQRGERRAEEQPAQPDTPSEFGR